MGSLKTLACLIAAVGVSVAAPAAMAQPDGKQPPPGERPGGPGGQGRQSLSPEALQAAWALQATGVAKHLGAADDKVSAVTKAYTAARESHFAAAEKLQKDMRDKAAGGGGGEKGGEKGGDKGEGRGPRGGIAGDFMKAMDELNAAEREKLKKELASSLSAEQVEKALASLGTFSRQWDAMANAVIGFKLEGAKLQDASNAMEEYVIALAKVRPAAGGGDPGAMREALQGARAKISESMKKLLTEEQFKTFERTLGGLGMGRGEGRGGGQRGGPKEPG